MKDDKENGPAGINKGLGVREGYALALSLKGLFNCIILLTYAHCHVHLLNNNTHC